MNSDGPAALIASLCLPGPRMTIVVSDTGSMASAGLGCDSTGAGLAVTFVRECGARVMIRGVRPLQDLENELTMMVANRQLDPEIETIVLMADKEFAHVSSSLIKEIARLAGDEELAHFVPKEVITALRKKIVSKK